MNWYYAIDGKEEGPVSEEDLKKLVSDRKIGPDNFVWNSEMGEEWAKASSLEWFSEVSPGKLRSSAPEPEIPPIPVDAPPASTMETNQEPEPESDMPPPCQGTDGQTPNAEITAHARSALSGSWGIAVACYAIWIGIMTGMSALQCLGAIASLVLSGPLMMGIHRFFLILSRGGAPEINDMFAGFKAFVNSLATYLLVALFVLLWSLLFVIPGIIASYAYALAFFVIAENPDMSPVDAINRSKELMKGKKWKLFCLHMRFLGWSLLCILTMGIGFLWLYPYMMTSSARFYDDAYGSE